jgi:hypothetical protein
VPLEALVLLQRAERDDLRRPRHDRRLELSDTWVRDVRQQDWWQDHIIGGLMTYGLYQHLGNQSPEATLRGDPGRAH